MIHNCKAVHVTGTQAVHGVVLPPPWRLVQVWAQQCALVPVQAALGRQQPVWPGPGT
jgi:hypothetical protein